MYRTCATGNHGYYSWSHMSKTCGHKTRAVTSSAHTVIENEIFMRLFKTYKNPKNKTFDHISSTPQNELKWALGYLYRTKIMLHRMRCARGYTCAWNILDLISNVDRMCIILKITMWQIFLNTGKAGYVWKRFFANPILIIWFCSIPKWGFM